jgi:hypothetical protein
MSGRRRSEAIPSVHQDEQPRVWMLDAFVGAGGQSEEKQATGFGSERLQ